MQWRRLTLGKPAALEAPPGTCVVERDLAALTGCQRAILGPSTLHLYWDLFGILARRDIRIFVDASSYPIANWGVERAVARGTPVRIFPRHDPQALRLLLAETANAKPVVVTDGYCPSCGATAPLSEYLACVRPLGGMVVVDDTQSLGIFGYTPGPNAPYGMGGGGSLRRQDIQDERVVLVSSLAKAFGAPVAMLAGSDRVISDFERESATRMHCSPPSTPVIVAASQALAINRSYGELLRQRLAQRVAQFRSGLRDTKLIATKSLFPLQPLRMPEGIDAGVVHETLSELGMQTVLHRGGNDRRLRLSFLITARHGENDIECAVASLLGLMRRWPIISFGRCRSVQMP
jgi:8-amino-7-oxononanoate synthase